MNQEQWENDFVEAGAALEHARWARWQNYLHSFLTWNNDLQAWVLPHEKKERWQSQIERYYGMLSEQEKESDRKEAREYLPLVHKAIAQERQRIKAVIEDNKISDGVVYDDGLPPADILPDMLRDIHIAREATNSTLEEVLKAIG